MPVFTGVLCTLVKSGLSYLRERSDKESERNLANLANLLANPGRPLVGRGCARGRQSGMRRRNGLGGVNTFHRSKSNNLD
jgi:hypothetical protein